MLWLCSSMVWNSNSKVNKYRIPKSLRFAVNYCRHRSTLSSCKKSLMVFACLWNCGIRSTHSTARLVERSSVCLSSRKGRRCNMISGSGSFCSGPIGFRKVWDFPSPFDWVFPFKWVFTPLACHVYEERRAMKSALHYTLQHYTHF